MEQSLKKIICTLSCIYKDWQTFHVLSDAPAISSVLARFQDIILALFCLHLISHRNPYVFDREMLCTGVSFIDNRSHHYKTCLCHFALICFPKQYFQFPCRVPDPDPEMTNKMMTWKVLFGFYY